MFPLEQVEGPESGREEWSPERITPEEKFLAAQPVDFDPLESVFKVPLPLDIPEPQTAAPAVVPPPVFSNLDEIAPQQQQIIGDSEFQPSHNFQFAASDFDFLLSKGGGGDQAVETPRDSLLLKFDPLLKAPVNRLSTTKEEDAEGVGVVEIAQLIETAPAAEEAEGGAGILLTALEASGFIAVSPASSSMNIEETAKNPQPHCADEEADEKMSVDNTMVLDGESITERNMSYSEVEQDFNSSNELDKKSKMNR